MGCEIDENGLYVGWSPLFDYYSLRTLKASELIPFPSKKSINISTESNSINITSDLNNIISYQLELERLYSLETRTVEEKRERRNKIE